MGMGLGLGMGMGHPGLRRLGRRSDQAGKGPPYTGEEVYDAETVCGIAGVGRPGMLQFWREVLILPNSLRRCSVESDV